MLGDIVVYLRLDVFRRKDARSRRFSAYRHLNSVVSGDGSIIDAVAGRQRGEEN